MIRYLESFPILVGSATPSTVSQLGQTMLSAYRWSNKRFALRLPPIAKPKIQARLEGGISASASYQANRHLIGSRPWKMNGQCGLKGRV